MLWGLVQDPWKCVDLSCLGVCMGPESSNCSCWPQRILLVPRHLEVMLARARLQFRGRLLL